MTTLATVADLGVGFGMLAIALAVPPTPSPLYDELAVCGPHAPPHRLAAADRGGVRLLVERHPPRVCAIAPPPHWSVALVAPTWDRDPRLVRNALPTTVHTMKHARQAALSAGLALAFERGDPELLRTVDADAVVEPAAGPRLPAWFPSAAAAREAGALLVGLDPETLVLAAVTPDMKSARATRDAVLAVLAAHSLEARSVCAPIAPATR